VIVLKCKNWANPVSPKLVKGFRIKTYDRGQDGTDRKAIDQSDDEKDTNALDAADVEDDSEKTFSLDAT